MGLRGSLRLGVAGKLRLLAATFLAALIAVLAITWQISREFSDVASELYRTSVSGLQHTVELTTLFQRQRALIVAAPAELDAGRQALSRANFDALSADVDDELSNYGGDGVEEAWALLTDLRTDMANFRREARNVFVYAEALLQSEAASAVAEPVEERADRVRRDIAGLTHLEQARAREKLALLEAARARLTRWVLLLGTGAVAAAGIGISRLAGGMSRRILRLAEVMRRIATRDVAAPVPFADDGDEIGEMARALDVFKENAIALQVREAELKKALVRAEAAALAKSQFLANMSHELRTPLNAVIGFSELIAGEKRGQFSPSKYAEYARYILQSGHHLLAVINDILDLSRIDADKLVLRDEVVPVDDLLESALRVLRAAAHDANVRLSRVPLPEGLPRLRCDPSRARQMLLNLVGNAIKFTKPGGSVLLSVRHAGALTIIVEDTGIGMEESEIAKALEPFGQVGASLARLHEGTGLGLPLTLRLIEAHGGALTIESEPGRGTRVALSFPSDRLVEQPLRALKQDRLTTEA